MKIYVVVTYGGDDNWYHIEGAFYDKHSALTLQRKLAKDYHLDKCVISQDEWENILVNCIDNDEFDKHTVDEIVDMFPEYSRDDVQTAIKRYDSGIIGINIEETELYETNT